MTGELSLLRAVKKLILDNKLYIYIYLQRVGRENLLKTPAK